MLRHNLRTNARANSRINVLFNTRMSFSDVSMRDVFFNFHVNVSDTNKCLKKGLVKGNLELDPRVGIVSYRFCM